MLLTEGLDIGLATVYRVLTQFEQAGLLVRHHFESGKAVFELNQGKHHDHLVCMQCGRVEEFYDAEIEKRQIESRAATAASRSASTRSICMPTARNRAARTASAGDRAEAAARARYGSASSAANESGASIASRRLNCARRNPSA